MFQLHTCMLRVKQFGYSFAFDAPTVWNAFCDDILPPSPLSESNIKLTCTPL